MTEQREGGDAGHAGRAPSFDRGRAGRSAEAEYERRRAADEAARRERFGRLAWVAGVVAGERRTTWAWSTGARGERRAGALLERALGRRGIVLHDRSMPGSRANIDHLVVAPSGVWVVDAKKYRGRVERRNVGGWFRKDLTLYVGGRDRSRTLEGVRRQRAAVAGVLRRELGDDTPPLHSAVCLVDADWDLFARPYVLDGVWVTWPRRLGETARRGALLERAQVEVVAALLVERFPVR